jgi:hypothetical protein
MGIISFQKQNNPACILFQRNSLPLPSEILLKKNYKFLSNSATKNICYPNLDHIMFILHCENLKKNFWMVHPGKTELQIPH